MRLQVQTLVHLCRGHRSLQPTEIRMVEGRVCSGFWRTPFGLVLPGMVRSRQAVEATTFYSSFQGCVGLRWSSIPPHTSSKQTFCCFTACGVRSLACLVKSRSGSSWLWDATTRLLNGSVRVPGCDIWAEWWQSVTDASVLESFFSPTGASVGEALQIAGAAEK